LQQVLTSENGRAVAIHHSNAQKEMSSGRITRLPTVVRQSRGDNHLQGVTPVYWKSGDSV
jgi:hypothetical protein